MKFSKKSTSTLFFIIFSYFFQTLFGSAIEESDRISHYHLRTNATSEDFVKKLLEEINDPDGTKKPVYINLSEDIINLLTGCEIRPNGILGTNPGNQVYFVRKISKGNNVNHSHLVIKQLAQNCKCEKDSLDAIFQMFRDKKVKLSLSRNNYSVAIPECTLTITDQDNVYKHFTIYHRVKASSVHDTFFHSPRSRINLANKLGQALFRLHESTRLNQKELQSLASKTDEINISRYYGDSGDLSFSVAASTQLLKISDPLVRMALVRCMGDLHTKNVFKLPSGSISFIDYTTLSRDTMEKNKCSLFTNDVSYFMYCCIYFYGEDFIKNTGIDFLSNFITSYFRTIHPQYHEKMLELVRSGFEFFITELTSPVAQNDGHANLQELNIPTEQEERSSYIEKIKIILKSIFFHGHGITYNSSNDEILDVINKYSDARRFIQSGFIDGVLNGTKQILSQTSWEEVQKEALRKVIQRRKKQSTKIISHR